MHQIPHFSWESPQHPFPMEKRHCCDSVTATTPWPPRIHTSLQQRSGNGVVVFLRATTGELLPTFCKGLSNLFPTEKTTNE